MIKTLKYRIFIIVVVMLVLSVSRETHADSCNEELVKDSVVFLSFYKEPNLIRSMTGVVVDKVGFILTDFALLDNEAINNKDLKEGYKIKVTTQSEDNSKSYKAAIYEYNKRTSLLVLQIDPHDIGSLMLKIAPVSSQEKILENNEKLCIIGYRRSKDYEGEYANTPEIISYIDEYKPRGQERDFLHSFKNTYQLDQEILKGSPVFNKDGQLVAIVSNDNFPKQFRSIDIVKKWLTSWRDENSNLNGNNILNDTVEIVGTVFDADTKKRLGGVNVKFPHYPKYNTPTDDLGNFRVFDHNKELKEMGAINIYFELEGYKSLPFNYKLGYLLQPSLEKIEGDEIND